MTKRLSILLCIGTLLLHSGCVEVVRPAPIPFKSPGPIGAADPVAAGLHH